MNELINLDGQSQSRLNSMIIRFINQNVQHQNSLIRLVEIRDNLSGNFDNAPKLTENETPISNGIMPNLENCLLIQSKQIQRLEEILKELSEYI